MMSGHTSVRPATINDCEAMGLITVTASLSAFVGHVPEESLDLSWSPDTSAAGWRRTLNELQASESFMVSEDDAQVIGFVWAGPSARRIDGEGEIRGLYVLPTRQGQGVGRELVSEAVRQLRNRGSTSLLIGCIAENPSCGFYRHLGGVETFRRPNTVDRHQTEEIFFAWADSTSLT